DAHRHHAIRGGVDRGTGAIGDVAPLRRIAGVGVRKHARHRALAAFVAERAKEPQAVLLDRPADAEIEVPDLARLARGGKTTGPQLFGVVAADHTLRHARGVEAAPHGI